MNAEKGVVEYLHSIGEEQDIHISVYQAR